jgi:hypothetical protein
MSSHTLANEGPVGFVGALAVSRIAAARGVGGVTGSRFSPPHPTKRSETSKSLRPTLRMVRHPFRRTPKSSFCRDAYEAYASIMARRERRFAVAAALALAPALAAWACKTSSDDAAPSNAADAGSDATTDSAAEPDTNDSGDAGQDRRPILDATCDARIVECATTPTQPSPTVNDPVACKAPAYDTYSTGDNNEQVEAACNAFCLAQNPTYADAGGFIGCNQTTAEQNLGTGAFHCVCAP